MICSAPLLLFLFFAAEPPASPADQLVELAKEGAAIKNSFHTALKEADHDRPRVIAANEKYRADSLAWAKRERSSQSTPRRTCNTRRDPNDESDLLRER